MTAPTWGAVVPRIVGDELVGRAIGFQQSLSSLAGLGGAAAGGLLYAAVGYHASLLIDTCTFALLVVVGALVRTRRGRRYDAGTGTARVVSEGDDASISGRSFIAGDGLLHLLVPALYLVVLGLEAPNVVEVFLITDDLGASASVYGLVTAAFLLGQIAGPLLAVKISAESSRVAWTACCAGVIGVLVIAIGLSPDVWLVLALFALCGLAGGVLTALIGTLVITRSPEHVRGRVLATVTGTAHGFSVLAMVLGGLGGQFIGARLTFVVCGVLGMLAAVVVLRSRRGLVTVAPTTRRSPPRCRRLTRAGGFDRQRERRLKVTGSDGFDRQPAGSDGFDKLNQRERTCGGGVGLGPWGYDRPQAGRKLAHRHGRCARPRGAARCPGAAEFLAASARARGGSSWFSPTTRSSPRVTCAPGC